MVLPGAFLVIVTGVTLRLLDGPDVFDVVMSVFQVGVFGLLTATNTFCPPAVFLQSLGIRTRRFLWSGPLIPWADVRDVQVQGRWQDLSSVIHRDGRLMSLVGMPVADAQRLADALQTARGSGT